MIRVSPPTPFQVRQCCRARCHQSSQEPRRTILTAQARTGHDHPDRSSRANRPSVSQRTVGTCPGSMMQIDELGRRPRTPAVSSPWTAGSRWVRSMVIAIKDLANYATCFGTRKKPTATTLSDMATASLARKPARNSRRLRCWKFVGEVRRDAEGKPRKRRWCQRSSILKIVLRRSWKHLASMFFVGHRDCPCRVWVSSRSVGGTIREGMRLILRQWPACEPTASVPCPSWTDGTPRSCRDTLLRRLGFPSDQTLGCIRGNGGRRGAISSRKTAIYRGASMPKRT